MKFAEWRCTTAFTVSTAMVIFAHPENTVWWQYLGSVILYYAIVLWGLSAVYHRWYCHGAYDAPDWFVNIGAALFMSVGVGTPRSWSAIHTAHHIYSDTDKDPHSPRHKPWRTFLHAPVAIFNRKVVEKMNPRTQTKNQKLLTKYYTPMVLAWVTFLALLSYEALFFVFLLPACLVGIGTSLSNNIPHLIKWKHPYKKEKTVYDMPAIWGLVFTEGYHNTHHAKPWLWEYREDGKGLDFTATMIRLVKYPDK